MSTSTKGVPLHYYKYSDNSVIAKIFTEEFGLQSFVVKGVQNKKSKNKLSLLYPLNLIHLEITNNPKLKMQYVKEIRLSETLPEVLGNINKQFICMFISEILMRVLVESQQEKNLFNFITNTIKLINKKGNLSQNFAIVFLINLSGYLGFYPSNYNNNLDFFDLNGGCFTSKSAYYNISGKNKEYFASILINNDIIIPFSNRRELLKSLQTYFKLHHYDIENLKSYEVIESLRS